MGSLPKAEFLDDLEGMLDEIIESDARPILRLQGRGQGVTRFPNRYVVEATIIVTHLDYSK